ncbi:hypothetical protein B0H16DRAFT_1496422 [Mycena metata]|uniref:Uncharacterized protein n=1 Tax=Mycena metata TaxID=1033252 RepID=A0AAD7KDC2_9AGAR|nr:hypothetical protein B0H16DRAFT_1496422 [Mycena metata]
MNFPRQTATNDSLSDSASASPTPASVPSESVASAAQPSLARAASLNDTNSDTQSDQQSASASSAAASSSGASASSSASLSDPPPSSTSHSSSKSSSDQAQLSSSSSLPSSSASPNPSSSSQSANPSSSANVSLLVSASASAVSGTSASTITGSANVTTILSTDSNGQVVTITTTPPTLSTAPASVTAAQRTAIIAGATAGGVGLVLFLLAAVFVYRRHKSRRQEFSEAVGRVRREAQGAGGMGLLDEEGFEDDDAVPMRRYRDDGASHSRSLSSLGPPQSPAPSLFRQRAETGSLFREEGVWPPPQGTHFVDPLVGVGTGEGLGTLVDDIMGPDPTHAKDRGNIPSMSSATSSMYADPFRSTSHPSAPSDPSLYFDRRGASSSMSIHSQQTSGHHSQQSSGSRPATPQSLLGLPAGAAGTPKKPSPLAHPVNPPSSATWLTRSPKKPAARLSESSEG